MSTVPSENKLAATLRLILLGIVVLGSAGTLAELLLLEHLEDWRQKIPPSLLALALVGLAAFGATRARAVLLGLRALFVAFVASGVVGIYFHVQGNAEFEVEMSPALGGLELLWESLRGAFPALAPGTMIQLGLVGLAYLYRHPVLVAGQNDT